MIVFDLHCEHGHRFEGWFKSSSDYESQNERGLVICPECSTHVVSKAPMAPAVPAKSNTLPTPSPESETLPQTVAAPAAKESQSVSNTPPPAEVKKAMEALAKVQAKALENSTYVGKDFAKQSREMHYGERDAEVIHGQASLEEAKELVEEGVQVAPLPFPVASPEKLN